MLSALVRALSFALVLGSSVTAAAQDTSFVSAMRASSSAFTITDGHLAGRGADALRQIANENQFILVGEDHGIRELPEFVSALFEAARPAGYKHLALEIGPITGRRLQKMMRKPDAQQELNAFLGEYTGFTIPFFFWKEEAQMLESVVKSVPSTRGVVWGLDQEFIMSPTYMFARLAEIAPSKSARALALQMMRESARADSAMIRTANPGVVWMVSSSDEEVSRLKAAFSGKTGNEADEIIRELATSREIYRMFNSGTNYESNEKRVKLMKRHFIADYNAARARGESMPKAIIKLGANHVIRGPSTTDSYEIGSFVPEFAATTGGTSFGILVVVAKGTWNAYRPFGSEEADKTQKYDPNTTSEYSAFDMKSILSASDSKAWTFIDLRPVRAAVADRHLKGLNPKARRLVTSFDGVVVVPEGHASVYFR